eukprot:2335112-Amphidinium_carterae.1
MTQSEPIDMKNGRMKVVHPAQLAPMPTQVQDWRHCILCWPAGPVEPLQVLSLIHISEPTRPRLI